MTHSSEDLLDLLVDTTHTPTPKHDFFVRCLQSVKQALHKQGVYHLCIKLCDEPMSQLTNHQLRGIDKPTNVIAIDYQVHLPTEVHFLGDLLLCVPVITQQASVQNAVSPSDYWATVAMHGILHLFGFDHQTDAQEEEMKAFEQTALVRFQKVGML